MSQKFEQEDGILDEAKKQAQRVDNLFLWQKFCRYDEEDGYYSYYGYYSYCEVKFEASPEFVEKSQGHLRSVKSDFQTECIKRNALESAPPPTSNLSSCPIVDENHSIHDNVRFLFCL